MADSLVPWIAQYLVSVGEEYGADLAGVKVCKKSQKGQIIRFLTDPSKEGAVWGMLSDGEYSLPMKFDATAMDEERSLHYEEYMADNILMSVRTYKMIFCRTPLGNSSGLSPESRLAIECSAFTRSQRCTEMILGSPKSIASHPDLHEWSEGLSKHGGAGNILKQKKMATGNSHIVPVPPARPVAQGPRAPKTIARSKAHLPEELFLSFINQLVFNDRNTPAQRHPVEKVVVATSRPKPIRQPESSPEIAIPWSPTPDRRRSIPPAGNTRLPPSQLLLSDCDIPEEADTDVPSSSLPQPQEATLEEDKMDLDLQRPICYEQPYPSQSRKVPRPPSPKALPKGGSGMILVPNSDVSMAGSSQPSQTVASQERKPLRRALSQRDLNSFTEQHQHQRGRKRANVQQSQDTYDGDEESVEKLRTVKKQRRSENKEGESYPWPRVSAQDLLDVFAKVDRLRGDVN